MENAFKNLAFRIKFYRKDLTFDVSGIVKTVIRKKYSQI